MSASADLRQFAQAHGIDLVGITSARPFLVGDDRRPVDPRDYLGSAQSLVVLACYMYRGSPACPPQVAGKPRGRTGSYLGPYRVARYYSEKLISEYLASAGHAAVVSNRIPFKMAAVRSGIAQYGKNCLVHSDQFGSYLELGCVITDAPLESSNLSAETSDCGDCNACLGGCPTGAIDRPYQVVPDQCMGRWLGDGLRIPREFREKVGINILRCSKCHDICPKNRGLSPRQYAPFPLEKFDSSPELIPLLLGSEEYYLKTLPGFNVYTNLNVLHRNVAIALGNARDKAAIPALCHSLTSTYPETRAVSGWALGKLGGKTAESALLEAISKELDDEIREDLQASLRMASV
jgi:epoxyqueuosine reductase